MRAIHIIGWILIGIAGVVVIGLIVGIGIQYLWNWLMPEIFGLPVISFWQAVGLFILLHILIGGHHAHHPRPRKKNGWNKLRDKIHAGLRFHGTDEAGADDAEVRE